ncbi:hypothetical protein [Rhodococcus qingshengii]|uniref:hypothetical protein n=1 Tax=Rhodococcus qingshengii TaxID=334542 RepID=UPI0035D73C4D
MVNEIIKTQNLSATDAEPRRVKASYRGATLILSWDHSLLDEDMHESVVRKLVEMMEGKPITIVHTSNHAYGYTFRVTDAG